MPAAAHALQIFACEPEWAALARVLAPEARIVTATHSNQDPHHVEARPALIGALRRADLAVCTGASLEAGWLPALQQRASNPAVQTGRDGMLFAAERVTLIDAHAVVDRSMGDVHPEGNPHFHLDPERLRPIARELAERLARIDPASASAYRERQRSWDETWARRMGEWKARAAPLAGLKVAAQHTGFAYLWQWLGIDQVIDLEPKPGLPPTIRHLQSVLADARSERPVAIVQTPFQDPQAGRWLAEQIRVPLLTLPGTVTADGDTATLEGLFDMLIDELLRVGRGDAGR